MQAVEVIGVVWGIIVGLAGVISAAPVAWRWIKHVHDRSSVRSFEVTIADPANRHDQEGWVRLWP